MRRVLRQDPDVILIGELRDEETVQTALSAAETGHLVLSTVHTLDATETVNRLIEFFPPHMHQQVRAMIAGTLKGAISQRLVRGAGGKGRVATCEVLRSTGRVKDMILDPLQTGKLHEVIAEGGYYGMQTFDQALFDHLKAGRIEMEDAVARLHQPARLQAPRRLRRPPRHHDGRPPAGRGRARHRRPGRLSPPLTESGAVPCPLNRFRTRGTDPSVRRAAASLSYVAVRPSRRNAPRSVIGIAKSSTALSIQRPSLGGRGPPAARRSTGTRAGGS